MGIKPKAALTFEEKITAAYLYFVRGVNQADITVAMGGVNQGRVNEACMAVKKALYNIPAVPEKDEDEIR